MNQGQVVGFVLALAAAFFAGRGYERAKARFAVWRVEPGTVLFARRVRNLALLALFVGVAVIAVQARR